MCVWSGISRYRQANKIKLASNDLFYENSDMELTTQSKRIHKENKYRVGVR